VVNRQTPYHAWYYTDLAQRLADPPHTIHRLILDALWRYMRAATASEQRYWRGLVRAEHLFEPTRAALDERPHIPTTSTARRRASSPSRHRSRHCALAERIARWALDDMYDAEGRLIPAHAATRRHLRRWCNADSARPRRSGDRAA
jgi:hypothetical protein